MRRIAWWLSALVIAVGMNVSTLDAQSFEGSGQEATELFVLDAGLAVFVTEHRGSGAFLVRLLDERGALVEEVARGSGVFGGSKAVRVPQAGRYLLDVSATGPWSVRMRDPAAASAASVMPDTASPVYKAAAAAAREVPTHSWFARGLAGGILGGPLGAAVAVGFANRSEVPSPALVADGAPSSDPGFDVAFTARVRESRKRKAFIGGMVGSGVFLAAIVVALDIAQGGEGGGGGATDPGGGGVFVVVPR